MPERIIGRYSLGKKIAAGGMATVHLGRVTRLARVHAHGRDQAPARRFARDPDFVSMFVDEARLAARIRHPNVVPVLDVVVDTGEVFVVLEYVHGEPLHRLTRALPKGQAIPVRIACGIVFGVLLGLHAAHDARNERGKPLRIVHRDVSPQNVLVGPDGVARLVDFGVAKAIGRMRTTEDKEVKGKIDLSPEQVRGLPLDQRTDVYAASVVLWELLAGMRLFRANETAARYAIVDGEVERPSAFSTECTPELDAIAPRGLARNPDERWPTARAMALALEACVPPASSRTSVRGSSASRTKPSPTAQWSSPPWKPTVAQRPSTRS